jgi:hypothetical protein
MKRKRLQQWGDPWSYSDVMFAKSRLVRPNKVICIRCLEQAKTEPEIPHKTGCPTVPKVSPTVTNTEE